MTLIRRLVGLSAISLTLWARSEAQAQDQELEQEQEQEQEAICSLMVSEPSCEYEDGVPVQCTSASVRYDCRTSGGASQSAACVAADVRFTTAHESPGRLSASPANVQLTCGSPATVVAGAEQHGWATLTCSGLALRANPAVGARNSGAVGRRCQNLDEGTPRVACAGATIATAEGPSLFVLEEETWCVGGDRIAAPVQARVATERYVLPPSIELEAGSEDDSKVQASFELRIGLAAKLSLGIAPSIELSTPSGFGELFGGKGNEGQFASGVGAGLTLNLIGHRIEGERAAFPRWVVSVGGRGSRESGETLVRGDNELYRVESYEQGLYAVTAYGAFVATMPRAMLIVESYAQHASELNISSRTARFCGSEGEVALGSVTVDAQRCRELPIGQEAVDSEGWWLAGAGIATASRDARVRVGLDLRGFAAEQDDKLGYRFGMPLAFDLSRGQLSGGDYTGVLALVPYLRYNPDGDDDTDDRYFGIGVEVRGRPSTNALLNVARVLAR